MSDFQFGAHAIHTPDSEARFIERRDSVIDSVKPANVVEGILTEELLHASWEMQRVRDHSANADTTAEARLNSAHTRASRNWHRSLNQLKRLQSARASIDCELYHLAEQQVADQCPLADLTKLPKPLVIDTPEVQ